MPKIKNKSVEKINVEILPEVRKKVIEKIDKLTMNVMILPETGFPLKLTKYQTKIIKTILKRQHYKYVVVSCTRAGKTTAMAVSAIWLAVLYPNEEIVIVAPTFRQSQIMFSKIRNIILASSLLKKLLDTSKGFRQDFIAFKNGSIIRCLSSHNPESTLGYGASVLIIDEAGSIPDEVIKTRLLRMIMSKRRHRSLLILVGTPHQQNYLWEAFNSEEFVKFRITWRDAVKEGVMSKEDVEYAKKTLSDIQFRIWYEAEFISEGGLYSYDIVKDNIIEYHPRREKYPNTVRYMGLDVARLGRDESAIVIVDVTADFNASDGVAEIVYIETKAKKTLNEIIGWAEHLMKEFEVDYVAVDAIGLGSGVLDILRERLGGVVVGVKAVGDTRTDMYLFLRKLLLENRITIPNYPKLIHQFKSYTVEYTSTGKIKINKNPHMNDDTVDALVMALYLAKSKGIRLTTSDSLFEKINEWVNL